ncbi:MAG: XdhC family protein [Litoreibacter sp.]|nr:XdhC family protein [Litoreibacter sp.]
MTAEYDSIPETALAWHRAGKGAALATVVETWGSAPRRVGSQLAISGEGEIAGSVSGGCVEGAVVVEAMDAIEGGMPLLLEYGVSDDEAFAVGLACGGTIRILLEPVGKALPEVMLTELVDARASKEPIAYTVDTASWDRKLLRPEDGHAERFAADKSGFEGDRFIAIHNPPLRMAIVGAVHIAQPLSQMARLAGFEPFIIDPRAAFASEARFPGETLSHDWPDEALEAFQLDARSAVVTLTHDPKIDDPAIEATLRSNCFYLGCLGSTRTHAKRVARLEQAGFTADQIARINGPVGLDVGGQTPGEIASAILSEVILSLRGPKGRG